MSDGLIPQRTQVYEWQRFWMLRGTTLDLSNERAWNVYSNRPDSRLSTFLDISSVPCLGLVGEKGSGKSHTLRAEYAVVHRLLKAQGHETLLLDLEAYTSDFSLMHRLFNSPEFCAWSTGTHELHIFLDSLDECQLRFDTVAQFLLAELHVYHAHLHRLRLRICCRTAAWPELLENGLQKLWGPADVRVYELAPLRQEDVAHAAHANNLDATNFIATVEDRDAIPLATNPFTLDFLLNYYREHIQLPPTQIVLYEAGCWYHCRDAHHSPKYSSLTTDTRLTLAARIAALTVFTNRYRISTDPDPLPDASAEGLLTFRDLWGIEERTAGESIPVGSAELEETLRDTSLFASRGSQQLGWVHQVYAEFLAAWYLVQHKVAPQQILRLLQHPHDSEHTVVPQLRATAGWLADMVPEVFETILVWEPDLLLRGDFDRATLVSGLLRLHDAGELPYQPRPTRYYARLLHPGLADQLRSYITDKAKRADSRLVAIEIAQHCRLSILADDLVTLALDSGELEYLRILAAQTVTEIGEVETRTKLKPLIVEHNPDYRSHDLKGHALRALWPVALSADEVFAVLTLPSHYDAFGGPYRDFISEDLINGLQPADLPAALQWVERLPVGDRYSMLPSTQDLLGRILSKAWEYLDSPGVTEAFARAILLQAHRFDMERKIKLEDDQKRHQVIRMVLKLLTSDEKQVHDIAVLAWSGLFVQADFAWLLDLLPTVQDTEKYALLIEILPMVFDKNQPQHLEMLRSASLDHPLLAQTFFTALNPDSELAQKQRTDYLAMLKVLQATPEPPPLLDPPVTVRVSTLLDQLEAGKLGAWWHLNRVLTLALDSTHYGDSYQSDLTSLPGWKATDSPTKTRIVAAAKRYLLEYSPAPDSWSRPASHYPPEEAGYRALRLLWQEDPSALADLSHTIWRDWAAVILAYPSWNDANPRPQQELVYRAYQYAPDTIMSTFLRLIDAYNTEQSYLFFLTDRLALCWEAFSMNMVLSQLEDQALKPTYLGSLLQPLLERGFAAANAFATSLVNQGPSVEGDLRARSAIAGALLLLHTTDSDWPTVWSLIQDHTAFRRDVFSVLLDFSEQGKHTLALFQRLSEDQLADLYLALVQDYPPSEDPEHEPFVAYSPEFRDEIANLRNSFLQQLRNRASSRALAAIQRIAVQLPGAGLARIIRELQEQIRATSWLPLAPATVLQLIQNPQIRLIQNGDQLLDVLIESLHRLERELQDETPAAIDLWNETADRIYRPKDENRMSDYIQRYFRRDLTPRLGVLFHREVEIRRGEETDIQVSVAIPNGAGYTRLSAIIEAKGCWHDKVNTAMQTQLVDRYLRENSCQHGLYLVGWFLCDKWNDPDDSRYAKAQRLGESPSELQRQLESQSKSLSQPGGVQVRAFVLNATIRSDGSADEAGAQSNPKRRSSRRSATTPDV